MVTAAAARAAATAASLLAHKHPELKSRVGAIAAYARHAGKAAAVAANAANSGDPAEAEAAAAGAEAARRHAEQALANMEHMALVIFVCPARAWFGSVQKTESFHLENER
jgi:hypothetical protein